MRITHSPHTLQTTIESVPAEGTMFESPAFKVFDFLFGIPLIHDIMFGIYRKQIVEKAGKNTVHSAKHTVMTPDIRTEKHIIMQCSAFDYTDKTRHSEERGKNSGNGRGK